MTSEELLKERAKLRKLVRSMAKAIHTILNEEYLYETGEEFPYPTRRLANRLERLTREAEELLEGKKHE